MEMEQGSRKFSLSYNNVKNIPLDKYEKNFTFIVNGKEYETSRYVADLLSPIVREYHFIDETMNSISIETTKEETSSTSNTRDYFQEFLRLVEFKPKTINEIERQHYIEYFIELGNIEEFIELEGELFEGEKQNLNKVIDRIISVNKIFNRMKQRTQNQENDLSGFNFNIEKMIPILSSHFSELSKEQIEKMPLEIVEEILNDDKLKIDDEDSLLNLIISLYEENNKYCILFEYVKYENLQKETLCKFIKVFNINHINNGIWKSICKRLASSSSEEQEQGKRYKENIKEFKHEQGKEFEGIFRYLSSESKGNIHDNGTIKITSNSICNNSDQYHPKNLVDYQNDNNYYHSENEKDIMICFDFKDKKIQMTDYSIKSYNGSQTSGHLRNWVIEGSNDENSWEILDSHSNDSTLRGNKDIIATFNTKKTQTFYRFIRLRQTGESWYNNNNNYFLYFYFIEFYGKLKFEKK